MSVVAAPRFEPILVPHRLPGPAIEAILEERENRFRARCRLANGDVVLAHVPDRGRLLGILVPGARVLLFAADNPTRATRFSLLVAEDPIAKLFTAIDPAGANARVRPLLEKGLLTAVGAGWSVRAEATIGKSRIDYLLTRGAEVLAIEVKSVGVVKDGVALFPDAPTERGVKHLEELVAFKRAKKGRAMVLFVAQREDATAIAADREIDPEFAKALKKAAKTIEVQGVKFSVAARGCTFEGELPVLL